MFAVDVEAGGDGGVVFMESSSEESSDDSEAITLVSVSDEHGDEDGAESELMWCCVDADGESRSVTVGNSLSRVSTKEDDRDEEADDDDRNDSFFAVWTMEIGWFSSRSNSASETRAFSFRWCCCSAVTLFLLGRPLLLRALFLKLDMNNRLRYLKKSQ